MSGFFDYLSKSFDAGVASAKKSWNQALSFPTSAQCPSCANCNQVPFDAFAWRCINGHMNHPEAPRCDWCACTKDEVRSRGLYQPYIICYHCSRRIELKETAVGHSTSTALRNAGTTAQNFGNSVATEVKVLSSAPETFHCTHCNTELGMPTGPWQCGECRTHNEANHPNCVNKACRKSRLSQKILCGVCNQFTHIPSFKINDHLRNFGHTVTTSSKEGYTAYLENKPYCKCGICHNPITLYEKDCEQLGLDYIYPKKSDKSDKHGSEMTSGTGAYVQPAPPQPQHDMNPYGQITPQPYPSQPTPQTDYYAAQPQPQVNLTGTTTTTTTTTTNGPYQTGSNLYGNPAQSGSQGYEKDISGAAPPNYFDTQKYQPQVPPGQQQQQQQTFPQQQAHQPQIPAPYNPQTAPQAGSGAAPQQQSQQQQQQQTNTFSQIKPIHYGDVQLPSVRIGCEKCRTINIINELNVTYTKTGKVAKNDPKCEQNANFAHGSHQNSGVGQQGYAGHTHGNNNIEESQRMLDNTHMPNAPGYY
jgi:hypothetical protein